MENNRWFNAKEHSEHRREGTPSRSVAIFRGKIRCLTLAANKHYISLLRIVLCISIENRKTQRKYINWKLQRSRRREFQRKIIMHQVCEQMHVCVYQDSTTPILKRSKHHNKVFVLLVWPFFVFSPSKCIIIVVVVVVILTCTHRSSSCCWPHTAMKRDAWKVLRCICKKTSIGTKKIVIIVEQFDNASTCVQLHLLFEIMFVM